MKASELRIGNWFNSVKFGVPVICELTDFAELCHRSDGAYNDPPIDEYFEPIPLTEEWLLKFGFEDYRNKKNTVTKKAYFDIKIGTHFFPWNVEPKHSKLRILHQYDYWKVISPGNDSVRLQNVHQLQNLYFALTGDELKIKQKTINCN